MSRRKSTPSSDPSSRHAATALRCFEAVAARRCCASRVVVRRAMPLCDRGCYADAAARPIHAEGPPCC
jgi:hypothetical protein